MTPVKNATIALGVKPIKETVQYVVLARLSGKRLGEVGPHTPARIHRSNAHFFRNVFFCVKFTILKTQNKTKEVQKQT